MLNRFEHWLKTWKPIHLCWWFKKHRWKIPRYFIGSGSDFDLTGSRIANASRDWVENEDISVTEWEKTDKFIVAAMIECTSHNGAAGTVILRWRDVTDSGSFAPLASSGELNWGSGDITDLTNDNAVTSGEEGCTPGSAATWQNGIERENANDYSVPNLDDEYTEIQWAVDPAGADAGHQYEFELYDSTAGASVGTLVAKITMSAGITPKSVTDTGAGADTPSIAAGISLSDTGSGADSIPAITNELPITDTGLGVDTAPTITAAIPVIETGNGADVLGLAAEIPTTDTGSGADSVATLGTANVADVGSGADAIADLINSLTISETGSGIDVITDIINSFLLAEAGTSADSIKVASPKSVGDTGGGSDAITQINVAVPVADVGAGVDLIAGILNEFTVADVGAGVEAIAILGQIIAADSGVGVGTIASITVQFTLSDTGSGVDTASKRSLTAVTPYVQVLAENLANVLIVAEEMES